MPDESLESELVLTVEVKIVIPGIHSWPDAPAAVYFLRNPHRHQFVVRARREVGHVERETEFILFAQVLRDFFHSTWPLARASGVMDFGYLSCEAIAHRVVNKVPGVDWCSVSEDDEFTATCERIYLVGEEVGDGIDLGDEEDEPWKRGGN